MNEHEISALALERFLLKSGYSQSDYLSSPETFGDKFTDYENADVRVRIVRDPMQWFVNVGPRQEDLINVDAWMGVIGDLALDAPIVDFSTQVDFVEAYLPRMEALIRDDQSGIAKSLKVWREKRARHFGIL